MSDSVEEPLDDPKVTQGRHRCIVLGILFVAALGIAAIVVPLVVEQDCNCEDRGISPPPISVPTLTPPGPTAAPNTQPTTTTPAPTVSFAPSAAPSTQRLAQFIQIFLIPVSGEEVFEDTNSPQYRAAEFLADEDTIGPTLESTGQLADRYALSTFYYAMDGDDNWTSCKQGDTECEGGTAWMDPTVNHCEWAFIDCNDEGRVTDFVIRKLTRECSFFSQTAA